MGYSGDREGISDVRETLAGLLEALNTITAATGAIDVDAVEDVRATLHKFIRDDLPDVEAYVAGLVEDVAWLVEDAESNTLDEKAETLRTSADEFADLIEQAIGTCYPDEPIELHDIRIALHRFRETNT